MKIFSSEATDWGDFDGKEPPPRTPFLSPPKLSSAELTDSFGQFAKFVYDKIVVNEFNGTTDVNRDQLLWGIYTYFIDKLLVHENSGAPTTDGTTGKLLGAKQLDVTVFEFIKAYYETLTTDAERYYFQFYLQLGLYHFVVWYLCEKKGLPDRGVQYYYTENGEYSSTKNALFDSPPGVIEGATVTIVPALDADPVQYVYSSVSGSPPQPIGIINPSGNTGTSFDVYLLIHEFDSDFKTVVTNKVKWRLKRDGIELSDSFYTSNFYLRCFTPEMHINDLLSDDCLGITLRQERWRGLFDIFKYIGKPRLKKMLNPMTRSEAVKVFNKLVEAFHGAMRETLEEEIAWLVAGLDAPLRDSYKGIMHYGVGDGTETRALFGIQSYGLCFVRYAFDFTGDRPTIKLVIPDVEILRAPIDGANTNVSILYYGLDGTLPTNFGIQDAPSVVLNGYSDAGTLSPIRRQCVAPNKCFLVQSPGAMTYNDKLISFASVGGPSTVRVTANLGSSSLGLPDVSHEELVYIVFKNTIPRPSSFTGLYAEKTFISNEYQVPSGESDQFFSGNNDAQTLKTLILSLEGGNNFNFAVESDLIGAGLGRMTESVAIWDKVLPADNQVDGLATKDGELRRAVGYVSLYFGGGGSDVVIVFAVVGYVAPPACSWKTWTEWDVPQKLLAQRHIGDHLRKSGGDPIYNPALSAFRAFAMFEGMAHRIIAFAQTMQTAGEISATGVAAITTRLNLHLQNVAGAQFSQPGAERGPTVVRDKDDDTFGDGLGGKEGTILLIDYNLFHTFDH